MSQILDYLNMIKDSNMHPCFDTIVLEHGFQYQAPSKPRPDGIRKGRNKHCFENSYRLAEQTGWTYVEGLAIPDCLPVPLQHAWVVDPLGNVIETTWKLPGVEYYGIPFDLRFIHIVMLETKCYGVMNYRSQAFRDRFLMPLQT